MTASTEKAAPIPAEDAVNTVAGILALNYGREYVTGRDLEVAEEIVAALAGGQEERIREDERDRLYAKAREDRDRSWPDPRAWDACEWLSEEGAIHPIDRARLRGDAS